MQAAVQELIRRLRAAGPQTVLFDLDGTLVDSVPDVRTALNRMLADDGCRPLAEGEVRRIMGAGAERLIGDALSVAGKSARESYAGAVKRYLDFYRETPFERSRLFPGARSVIETLQQAGIALAIITNKPTDIAVSVLSGLNMDGYFKTVIGGETLLAKKPDPSMVAAALRAQGCAPSRAILVGDTATDIAAARAATVRSIAVSYGYSRQPVATLGADMVIDDLSELPGALYRLATAAVDDSGAPAPAVINSFQET